MKQRNDGLDEINSIQNRFTAYLCTAIKRKKNEYINQQRRKNSIEFSVDSESAWLEWERMHQVSGSFLHEMQWEKLALMEALDCLTEREIYILFETVLNGRKYNELTEKLGLQYSSVASIYYRAIKKMKRKLRGGDE